MTSETAEKEKKTKIVLANTKDITAALEKVLIPAMNYLVILLPMVIKTFNNLHVIWSKLDDNVVKSIVGFTFCFFGGMYPTLFAALQAAEQGGRALVVQSLKELAAEATRILNESKKDDEKSSTPSQTDSKEYVQHKTLFVLQKMNPEKVNSAISNLYKVWFAVISVLVVQFARTIQTANSIADFLIKPSDTYARPILEAMVPPEYQQWVPYILKWACKTFGMSLAWTLTSLRVAFASSLQGGLMLARSGLTALRQRKMTFGGKLELDHTKTRLDENAAYAFAAVGLLFQLYFRLSPPFPLNILFFPFRMAEWALRYGVMKASNSA